MSENEVQKFAGKGLLTISKGDHLLEKSQFWDYKLEGLEEPKWSLRVVSFFRGKITRFHRKKMDSIINAFIENALNSGLPDSRN